MVRKPAAFIKTILASSGRKKTVQVLSRLGQWLEGLKSVQLFCRTTRVPGSNVPAVRLLRCEAAVCGARRIHVATVIALASLWRCERG